MKEHDSKEARLEAMLNHSLGLLGPVESQELEAHLHSGCVECNADALSFAQVGGALGMSVRALEPPPRLRAQLLRAVAVLSAPQAYLEMRGWKVVHSALLPWQETKSPGIWEKRLLLDSIRHRSTRLIRMDAGARILAHQHHDNEESFVLEGTGELGGFLLGPGDYHRAPSGSIHPSYLSEKGCVFLVFSGTEYEFFSDKLEQGISNELITVHFGHGSWKAERLGLEIRPLFSSSAPLLETTALLRLAGGSVLATSEFSFAEAYVLEGRARLGSTELSAGDYVQPTEAERAGQLQGQETCTLLVRSDS